MKKLFNKLFIEISQVFLKVFISLRLKDLVSFHTAESFEELKQRILPLKSLCSIDFTATDSDGNIYDIIKGTCFICGLSYGDFTDLPEDLIEKFSDMFQYPELYVREPTGRVLQIRVGSGEKPRVLWK